MISKVMASSSGGYNCQFVVTVPEYMYIEPYCKKCNFIMREPYQATCCGTALCQTCFQQSKEDEEPCPDCGEERLEAYMDKKTKKQLSNFKVYCCNQDSGCEWSGKLLDIDDHLNCNPSSEDQLKGCQFTEIKCLYCKQLFMRCDINAHQNKQCKKRPFRCEYCKQYEATYEDVTTHWLKCSHYPELCPNKCGETLPRNKIANHMRFDCPMQAVSCDYKRIGCLADVIVRKDLPKHKKECMEYHMSLLSQQNERYARELDAKKSELATSKKQIKKLSDENTKLHQEIEKLRQQRQTDDAL